MELSERRWVADWHHNRQAKGPLTRRRHPFTAQGGGSRWPRADATTWSPMRTFSSPWITD